MDGETGESRRSTCRRNQRIASFGQQRSHGGEEADGWYLCRGPGRLAHRQAKDDSGDKANAAADHEGRSEEHTSELQSLMRISYAVFCLKKKTQNIMTSITNQKRTPI